MMFRRLDRWIVRHMSAKRWVVAWALLLSAAITQMVVSGGWVIAVGTPVAAISLFMAAANLARIR